MEAIHQNRLVLLSRNIFTATGDTPFDGFIAIEGNKIAAVGTREEVGRWTDGAKVVDLGEKLVTPGFVDVHTFFSGWVLRSLGVDFTGIHSDAAGIEALRQYSQTRPAGAPLFGHCWDADHFEITDDTLLDRAFPDTPVVVFTFDRDRCWMNQAAKDRYGFTPEECYAEKIWRMIRDYLAEPEMPEKYLEYCRMLNERGITTIKEMTFDDYYGFADVMERLEKENRLTVRVSMMSQPVGRGIDIPHGHAMKERFQGPFVSFSGYNRMTDRGIPSFLGELIEPYKSRPDITCLVPVEWDLIEKETLEAGKLADIAVIDRDLFHMPLNEAKNAKVCMTISDGHIVYDATGKE